MPWLRHWPEEWNACCSLLGGSLGIHPVGCSKSLTVARRWNNVKLHTSAPRSAWRDSAATLLKCYGKDVV